MAVSNTEITMELPLLVIGYGNTLRSDDGAGPRVAEAVAGWRLADVRAIAAHQLTPEMAEPIARAGTVVFVDASSDVGLGEPSIEPVAAGANSAAAHASDPPALLGLARSVYGICPPAWLLALPAEHFDLGEELSPKAQRGVEAALVDIRRMLHNARERGTL